MFVLQALESGNYSAFGAAILTDGVSRLFQFDAYFDVASTPVCFTAVGKFNLVAQPTRNDFLLEVRPFDDTGVSFTFRDQWIPQVAGTGSWIKDSYLLLGKCKRTFATVCCHVEPKENQIVEVKSLVQFPDGRRTAVQFTVAPHDPQTAMGNIISLHRRKRA